MAVDKKDLWVQWTHQAMTKYIPPDKVDEEELVDDMVEVTTRYADSMLDEFEERFGDGERIASRKSRRKKPEAEETED